MGRHITLAVAEVGCGGEWKPELPEKKIGGREKIEERERRNAGKGEEGKGVGFLEESEAGVGNAGFIKTQKPALGVPVIDCFIKC